MAMERDNRAPRSRKRRKVCAFCVDKVEIIDTVLQAAPEATFTIENQNALPSLHWLAAQGYIEEPT